MRPLALTMGDPAGIGPEIAGAAWRALRETGPAFCYVGDAAQLDVPTRTVTEPAGERFADALPVLQIDVGAVTPGRADPTHAAKTIAAIERAVACARAHTVRGIVTNPITKASLYAAGFPYPGHTEFLGALNGATAVMMLACPALRVVPVTVHLSLRDAVAALTTDMIVAVATITDRDLRRKFGIAAPRLAVAGLNPHAGEDGALGDEERRVIAPAIARLRAAGVDATGPYPPDTLFTPAARQGYDCAIGMYHDQVLIPLKTLDVFGGVNVTLGLPLIRTSPDHGTAYGIAGRGIADPGSLIAALRLADAIARRAEPDAGR